MFCNILYFRFHNEQLDVLTKDMGKVDVTHALCKLLVSESPPSYHRVHKRNVSLLVQRKSFENLFISYIKFPEPFCQINFSNLLFHDLNLGEQDTQGYNAKYSEI